MFVGDWFAIAQRISFRLFKLRPQVHSDRIVRRVMLKQSLAEIEKAPEVDVIANRKQGDRLNLGISVLKQQPLQADKVRACRIRGDKILSQTGENDSSKLRGVVDCRSSQNAIHGCNARGLFRAVG